jgi:hypothetical protein
VPTLCGSQDEFLVRRGGAEGHEALEFAGAGVTIDCSDGLDRHPGSVKAVRGEVGLDLVSELLTAQGRRGDHPDRCAVLGLQDLVFHDGVLSQEAAAEQVRVDLSGGVHEPVVHPPEGRVDPAS